MKSFGIRGKIFLMGSLRCVYVDKKISQQIHDTAQTRKLNPAFVRVHATIGKTSWTTSLFLTKDGPYLLAVKADVRRNEGIDDGDTVSVACTLL